MVADSQPTKYPPNTKASSPKSGKLLSRHLSRNTIAQAIKIPMLYSVHDLYDLLMS